MELEGLIEYDSVVAELCKMVMGFISYKASGERIRERPKAER
jgi:hypothetical protein